MLPSKDGIWWDKEKVDTLVSNVLREFKLSQEYGSITRYEAYVSCLRDTLLTMYGNEFTNLVFE